MGEYNDLSIIPKMTSGYHILPNDSLIVAPYRSLSTLKGAGSLYSNAYDLLKWNRSLISATIWGAKLKLALFTPTTNHVMPHNDNSLYGMGCYIHKRKGDRPKAYQVAGGIFGYSSISVIYPEDNLTLIILSNISFLPVNNLWSDVEKIIFNKPFQLPKLKQLTNSLSIENLKNFVGIYKANNNMKLNVFVYETSITKSLIPKDNDYMDATCDN
tara:strand:+ start:139 stop:780 length:642 start_codon:yes stop_codon:yes gene_type:complete